MGFIEEIKKPIPLLIIPMTHKSFEIYDIIFRELKYLLETLNIKINYDKFIFLTDYEKALRNSIKKFFQNHILKVVSSITLRSFGVTPKNILYVNKKLFKYTRLFILCLKIYLYILSEEKDKYLEDLKNILIKLTINL